MVPGESCSLLTFKSSSTVVAVLRPPIAPLLKCPPTVTLVSQVLVGLIRSLHPEGKSK